MAYSFAPQPPKQTLGNQQQDPNAQATPFTKPTGFGSFGGGLTGFGKPVGFGGPRTLGTAAMGTRTPPPPPPPPERGSESGPGILESWFNQRASGTDPAFEYGMKRGMEGLGNKYAAAGAFNSGAARQGESDLMANLISQRMGQLDALAGGASGEHQNRINSMFNQGLGLASGESGINSAYDLAAANAMSTNLNALLGMFMNKAGVDQKSNQQGLGNIIGFGSLFA